MKTMMILAAALGLAGLLRGTEDGGDPADLLKKTVLTLSEAIAKAYGLDDDLCSDIKLAAPMHDIGKVAIPDAVLLKKGKLTEGEFAEMQKRWDGRASR